LELSLFLLFSGDDLSETENEKQRTFAAIEDDDESGRDTIGL